MNVDRGSITMDGWRGTAQQECFQFWQPFEWEALNLPNRPPKLCKDQQSDQQLQIRWLNWESWKDWSPAPRTTPTFTFMGEETSLPPQPAWSKQPPFSFHGLPLPSLLHIRPILHRPSVETHFLIDLDFSRCKEGSEELPFSKIIFSMANKKLTQCIHDLFQHSFKVFEASYISFAWCSFQG